VQKKAPRLGRGHQLWHLNEINALIWPAPRGIGAMDPAAFQRTAAIAEEFRVIRKRPSGAYRTDLAVAAVKALQNEGIDVHGKRWRKAVVQVTPGGR